jgi:hypothetical protein
MLGGFRRLHLGRRMCMIITAVTREDWKDLVKFTLWGLLIFLVVYGAVVGYDIKTRRYSELFPWFGSKPRPQAGG